MARLDFLPEAATRNPGRQEHSMNDTCTQLVPALSAIVLMAVPAGLVWLGAMGQYLGPMLA